MTPRSTRAVATTTAAKRQKVVPKKTSYDIVIDEFASMVSEFERARDSLLGWNGGENNDNFIKWWEECVIARRELTMMTMM